MDLTQQQTDIVEYTENSFVLASAGSGKTTTVSEKIKYIKKIFSDARILYITFTRRAKRHALKKIGKVDNVLVTNFHSLAYMVLKNHKKKLEVSEIDIVSDSYSLSILKELFINDGMRELRKKLTLINMLKIECIALKDMSPEHKSIFIQFQTVLDNAKKFTYTDLLVKFKKLLDENELKEPFLAKILKFDYIMCDEVNDNNKIQFKILESLIKLSLEVKLTYVGDQIQTLYCWRGSRPDLCLNVINKYNMKLFPLTKNFRSQQSIIDLGNRMLDIIQEFSEFKYKMNYHKDRGSKIKYFHHNYISEYYEHICQCILSLIQMGFQYSDIYILFRKNSSGNRFERETIRRNIPFKLLKGNFLERKMIQYIINSIKTAFYILENAPKEEIHKYLYPFSFEVAPDVGEKSYRLVYKYKSDMSLIDRFKNIDELHIKGIGPVKRNSFKNFYNFLVNIVQAYLDNKDSPVAMINAFSNFVFEFKYYHEINNRMFNSAKDDVKEFIELISEMGGTIIERINIIATEFTGSEDNQDPENKMLGMTVHQAKGTEAPIVFIIDTQDFPLGFYIGEPEEEEEKRALYVAITRAMNHLYLFSTGENPCYYADSLFRDFEFVETNMDFSETVNCQW